MRTFAGKVIIISLMVIVGAFLYTRYSPSKVSDEVQGTDQPTFKKVIAQLALFFTESIVPDKSHTYIEFPYYFDKPHQEAWLSMQTQNNTQPKVFLIDHPIFENLTWANISNSEYTLYQKEMRYNSIADFIQNPPFQVSVVADPIIISEGILSKIPQAISLANWTPDTQFDYILTTRAIPEKKDNYEIYRKTFDASSAFITECGEKDPPNCKPRIGWKIDFLQGNEENPLYLGEIHVDYRQGVSDL